ncbi:hypothetical protein Pelo_19232 [Pelomyxa schiedti]|nr:hypothetical protein Pelo_19232 [Pelomyxa schiedti]
MASSTTRTVPHLPQPQRQGQPTIVVHLSARDQFAALATSSHSRCGARSPARLMTSQPALLIQLWDLLTAATTRATSTIGVTVTSLDVDSLRNRHIILTSFCVSNLLGTICSRPNSGRSWPPSQSTASSPVSVFEWDHDGVFHYEAMSVAPIRDTLLTNIAPESSNNKHGVGTGMVVNGVCEMVFSIAESSFWLRVPYVVTDDGEGGNKGSELLIHKGAFDVGSANSKWMVHSCMGFRGFRLVRLSDCSAKRIPVAESGERMRALYDNPLVSVFFNKSNEDEAVMVVEGFTMVAVDLSESFLSGFARVLMATGC